MLVDGFIFYNEMDLLTYRLNILHNLVDYFVIVESRHTFAGKEKSLFYGDNKHLFERFKDKIIHVVVDDFPFKYPAINYNNREQWKNEEFQRNAIDRGIKQIKNLQNNDLIMISDVDEIPDPHTLEKIKRNILQVQYSSLSMDFYYYNLNTRFREKWNMCKILNYEKYKEQNRNCNGIRYVGVPLVPQGGWHLSYFGDPHFIKNKINNFSHQELNNANFTDTHKIEERVKQGRDLYDRDSHPERILIRHNNYLPPQFNTYLQKYFFILKRK